MNTHETYVSLETAKLLKKTVFDWECEYCYRGDTRVLLNKQVLSNWSDSLTDAPTLSIAQKWLREVKGWDVYAYRDKCININYCYETQIGGAIDFSDSDYDTYESALEAGINKCLTLLLKEE